MTSRRHHQIPWNDTRVGNDLVQAASSIRDLQASIATSTIARIKIHVSELCRAALLRQIKNQHILRQIGLLDALSRARFSSRWSCHWLLVLSQLDYGNATLAGLPGRELNRLQSVLIAAARLFFAASKYEYATLLPHQCCVVFQVITYCGQLKLTSS